MIKYISVGDTESEGDEGLVWVRGDLQSVDHLPNGIDGALRRLADSHWAPPDAISGHSSDGHPNCTAAGAGVFFLFSQGLEQGPGMWTILQRASGRGPMAWRRLRVGPSGALKEDVIVGEDRRSTALHGHLERVSLLDRAMHRLRLALQATLLPVGYPHTVHPHFLPFTAWNVLQGVVGSAVGVLATQCLLVGLSSSSASSNSAAAVTGHAGSLALAATLNWILKDGLGNAGAILFVSRLGDRFDKDAKRYRFLAAAALNLAMLLECMVPLWPAAFLPLGAVANACKSIAWMANSATRAHLQCHFARGDNLGDITGKSAAAGTAASVLGTGLGVAISRLCLDEGGKGGVLSAEALVLRCLLLSLPLVAVCMWASYRSCRLGVSPRLLAPQRLDLVLRPLAASLLTPRGQLAPGPMSEPHRYILDPTVTGLKERFLRRRPCTVDFEPGMHRLMALLQDPQQAQAYCRFWEEHRFLAMLQRQDGRMAIWFAEEATVPCILAGLLTLHMARIIHEKQGGTVEWLAALRTASGHVGALGRDTLVEALKQRGWELAGTDLDRNPILITANSTQ